ncbi:MAG: hypothetical protein QOD91_1721, partial [Frankiales bacterium]|nr:hypothetical protein [Frankiales bacterium]
AVAAAGEVAVAGGLDAEGAAWEA